MDTTKLFLMATLLLFVIGCDQQSKPEETEVAVNHSVTIDGETMGTTYHIEYLDSTGKNCQHGVDSVLSVVNKLMSTFDNYSVISNLNQPYPTFTVNKLFLAVFNKAKEVYENTEGAYDPTVMPLVNAWGFGIIENKEVPDQEMIDSLLGHVGFEKVTIKETDYKEFMMYFLEKSDVDVQMDFSGIAKGYAVDVISIFLRRQGYNDHMVEIGGEIRAEGLNGKGEVWRIGIDRPIENITSSRELQGIISLDNLAVATSGNYRNFYEKEGKKYAHIINPKTGYPELSSLLSVSVISVSCMTADAYATAFMVMGLERSIDFVESDPSLDAYFIYEDEAGNIKTKYSSGMSKILIEEK